MTPARLDFTLFRGSEFDPIIINVTDDNDAVIDLTGWSVYAKTYNTNGKVLDIAPVITNPAGGEVTISFLAAETLGFDIGAHDWDLIFAKPDGERIGPYVKGIINVYDVVTH